MTCIEPGSLIADPRRMTIYLVVRTLEENVYLVVPKYRAPGRGPWRLGLLGRVDRVLHGYATSQVVEALERKEHDPRYGAEVEALGLLDYHVVFRPTLGTMDAAARASRLGARLPGWLVDMLVKGCAWFTGSLLAGMEHPGSDIDLLFDVSKCIPPEEPPENIERDHEYFTAQAEARGLSPKAVAMLIPWWQRFIYMGRSFSVTPVYLEQRCRAETRIYEVTTGTWRGVVRVEPLQWSAGDYPTIVSALTEEAGEVLLVSFDGFYSAALLEGGRFMVEGLRGYVVEAGGEKREILVVGARERPGYIVRA